MFLRSIRLLRERAGDPAAYPWSLPVVRSLDELTFPTPVTILVGENASGKSTLLEAIAVALGLNPEGGTANTTHSTRASHSDLHEALRPVRGTTRPRTSFFLRAESVFTLATAIEALDAEPGFGPPIIDAYGGRSLHEQSHGESFLAIAVNRLGPEGLYVLDEPEAALSPQGQLALIARILDLVADGSQLIIATHSPMLLAIPGATIYELDEDGALHVTPYDQTGHVRMTRAFLEAPEAYLRHLG